MITHDDDDPRLDVLTSLTPLIPDAARAERVRRRCHSDIARRARREARSEARARSTESVVGRRVVAALLVAYSAIYAAALIETTLRLEGVFRGFSL